VVYSFFKVLGVAETVSIFGAATGLRLDDRDIRV
jgi:hypothetical protein